MGTEPKREHWICLGLCPITCVVSVIAVGHSKEEVDRLAVERDSEHGATYIKSFLMADSDYVPGIFGWLRECGVTTEDAPKIIRTLGHALLELSEGPPPPERIDGNKVSYNTEQFGDKPFPIPRQTDSGNKPGSPEQPAP